MGDHVLAVVREGLTNAGKYAGATSYVVTLVVTDRLILEVEDDGTGIEYPYASQGSVWSTSGHRAEKLGGTFEIHPRERWGHTGCSGLSAVTIRGDLGSPSADPMDRRGRSGSGSVRILQSSESGAPYPSAPVLPPGNSTWKRFSRLSARFECGSIR